MSLTEKILSHGYNIDPKYNTGKFERFNHKGKLDGWYVAVDLGHTQFVNFGSFATGESFTVKSNSAGLTDSQKREVAAKQKELINRAAEEKQKAQATTAQLARTQFSSADQETPSPYLFSKKLLGNLYNCKTDSEGTLLVPVRDIDSKLHGLQRIYADGRKMFMSGMRKHECFHNLTSCEVRGAQTIYLAEGLATAASILEATILDNTIDTPVLATFDASNLIAVTALLLKETNSKIIICADNDQWKDRNKGLESASRCVELDPKRVFVTYPTFQENINNPTDFNDLHQLQGLTEVSKQLQNLSKPLNGSKTLMPKITNNQPPLAETNTIAEVSPKVVDAESQDSGCVDFEIETHEATEVSGNKKTKEQRAAKLFVKHHSNNILKINKKELIYYKDGKWNLPTSGDMHKVEVALENMLGEEAKNHEVISCFNTMMRHALEAPKETFKPNPYVTNFLNGTIHVNPDAAQKKFFTWSEHNRKDLCFTKLPYVIPKEIIDSLGSGHEIGGLDNVLWLDMVDRIFKNDPDKEEKIWAIKEMAGAALAPIEPMIFFLKGKGGSGKSSIILNIANLVDESNSCGVDPSQFKDFGMENMVGKLVNILTDIDEEAPIREGIVKQIIDRRPIQINRKGKQIIMAPLPAIHIFGSNNNPRIKDGASGAHRRRWILIETNQTFTNSPDYDKHFADKVFKSNTIGLVKFALQGVKRLLENKGHYTQPKSGRETLEIIQQDSDPVGQFLEEFVQNEAKIRDGSFKKYPRIDAWKEFKDCQKRGDVFVSHLGKKMFYKELRLRGVRDLRDEHGRYFDFSVLRQEH